MLTRVSMRASGPPGTAVDAAPEGEVLAGVVTVDAELRRVLEAAGVAVRRTVEHHQGCAGGDVDPGNGRPAAGEPEVAFDRSLDPERLLDEVGDELAPLPEELLELGTVADELEGGAEEPDRRLLSGGEEVGGDTDDVDDLGQRAVRGTWWWRGR